MAIIRKSLDEVLANAPEIDRATLARTTDDDIRRQQIEDGDDPDASVEKLRENVVRQARHNLGISADEPADLTWIPLTSLQEWERMHSTPDPAARSLLKILWLRPDEVRAALLSLKQRSAA